MIDNICPRLEEGSHTPSSTTHVAYLRLAWPTLKDDAVLCKRAITPPSTRRLRAGGENDRGKYRRHRSLDAGTVERDLSVHPSSGSITTCRGRSSLPPYRLAEGRKSSP